MREEFGLRNIQKCSPDVVRNSSGLRSVNGECDGKDGGIGKKNKCVTDRVSRGQCGHVGKKTESMNELLRVISV